MSSSEVSSSDSEVASLSNRPHTRGKGKKPSKGRRSSVVATRHGKNEGHDPDWAYKPPDGAKLVEFSDEADDMDWDALAGDEDRELWIIRVPEGVRCGPRSMYCCATS